MIYRGAVKINGARKVVGTMRGYDQFMNIVLEDAVEDRGAQGKFPIPDMLVTTLSGACATLCRSSLVLVFLSF
jgi:small nuclear ribonucleoprotein (snRNP)-like protein